MRGEGVESFEEIVFGSIEHAEVVEGAAAAEMLRGEGDAETGGGENLVGGSHGGGVEVVVEGVGPEEDFGGFWCERDAAIAVTAGVAGETAVGCEGFGEAGEGSVGMDVEDFFDDGADDGCVVDGVDSARGQGGDAGELIDAAEGVVEERARGGFEVMGEEFSLVGGHVDRDWALGFAGLAGEAEIERLANLVVGPFVGEDFVLHELPEEMGAAAGGVELFAGGHEAGTHGGGVGFAAGSDAYAAHEG